MCIRDRLVPEHKIECLSPSKVDLLYDCMREDKCTDPVQLDLCEYQAIEPVVHPFSLLREENDPIIEVSPYEALVIQNASKTGAIESLPDPKPQQEILTDVQIPKNVPVSQTKTDQILTDSRKEVNVQDMDSWSVFTDKLRYTAPATSAPGFDIQGQGCLDFSPERVNHLDQAQDVSMAPLNLNICSPVSIWIGMKASQQN